MQVCTSLQTDNHASTPPLSFFTGRMPFLPLNQQRQSTEGKNKLTEQRKANTKFGETSIMSLVSNLFAAQLFIKHLCFLLADKINTPFNS